MAARIMDVNSVRFAAAFVEFRKASHDSSHNVRLLQLAGYAALRSGSPHEAEMYFQSALAEKPANQSLASSGRSQ
jgi:Flp pilus assembly protein TadD